MPPVRRPWRAIDQRLQIPLGAGDREILEHVAARIHDGDHDRGQVLAERERGRHRDEGDGVDAEPAREEVADHRDQEAGHHGRGAGGPDPAGQLRTPGSPCEQAEHDSRQRDDD